MVPKDDEENRPVKYSMRPGCLGLGDEFEKRSDDVGVLLDNGGQPEKSPKALQRYFIDKV